MGDLLFQSSRYKIYCAKKKSMDGLDFKFCQSLFLPDNIWHYHICYHFGKHLNNQIITKERKYMRE